MNMTVKYQFETDFEDSMLIEEEAELVEELPPEPTFVEADLTAARADGFSQGREEGLAEARDAIENALAQSLAAVSEQLAAMSAQYSEAWTACQRQALALSTAITRKIVPELAISAALGTIEERVSSALPRLIEEPRVVIRVPDGILDPLRERIGAIAESAGFTGHCILLAEPGLTTTDCHIEWADGGAEYDGKRMWQEIDSAVDAYLAVAPPTSDAGQISPDAAGETASEPEPEPELEPELEQINLDSNPQEITHG